MKNRTSSFTFIELLVVIATITILAALLIPILNAAKAKRLEKKLENMERNFEADIGHMSYFRVDYPNDLYFTKASDMSAAMRRVYDWENTHTNLEVTSVQLLMNGKRIFGAVLYHHPRITTNNTPLIHLEQ